MSPQDWDETARQFAQEMGKYRLLKERGAVPFRFIDDRAQSLRTLDNSPVIVGVFGNDSGKSLFGDSLAWREVKEIRMRMTDEPVRELGFGVSQGGGTWALLFEAESDRFHTAAGRMFQRELLAARLETVVWDAWRAVSAQPAEQVPSA
jgi:hypothetical protein